MSQAATDREKSAKRASDALPDETLIGWLRDMLLIREFENRTMQAYQQAKIGGFCHVYTGQEACAVGTIACIEPYDPIVTAYRDHGHALARGMSPEACMAEMFGKITGCAKGKGGSMHMFDRPNELYGGHGIVGAQTPLGAGLAFASRYYWEVMEQGPKKVCLCYLGDGAVDQGAFHESLNLVAVHSIPVIYIIENNGYSMGTAIHRHTANHANLHRRGETYGIKSVFIDGFDVRDVYDAFKPLVDECRDLQRPGFVDLKTYRYHGHSMSDPQKYRSKEEVDRWKAKDPIARMAAYLMDERGCLSEEEWGTMEDEIKERVKAAMVFADQSPAPEAATELASDVYAYPIKNLSPIETYRHGLKNPLL
ncbi:MAG: pyruvate dehydrogenase (acetyl-transferring) E1 component subunit alpha [Planctomycetota bacterium]|nr:MAG: pyruvate dehydrogenase (acetyl-transferring) E1 component subunit alpha [Planctomycetota bacterium]